MEKNTKLIELSNIKYSYHESLRNKVSVIEAGNLCIEKGENVGILGKNGSGKTTLCRLVSGSLPLTHGKRFIYSKVSWPVGVLNTLSPNLTCKQNILFIATLYKIDPKFLVEKTLDYADLRDYAEMRVSNLSSGMRARLNFYLSIILEFDLYIFDEVFAVGDKNFRAKSIEIFDGLRNNSSILFCSHDENLIKRNTNSCYVLNNGILSRKMPTLDALNYYNELTKHD